MVVVAAADFQSEVAEAHTDCMRCQEKIAAVEDYSNCC